jgi:hypothetical protein
MGGFRIATPYRRARGPDPTLFHPESGARCGAAPWLTGQTRVRRWSVHDRDTGAAVAGAFVVLLGAEGERVSAILTDRNGWFTPRRLAAGTYVPRVERIGVGTEGSRPVTLADGGRRTDPSVDIYPYRMYGFPYEDDVEHR